MSGGAPFLDRQANGTSDANGNVTLAFPTIPGQQNWQGIVSVPNATPGSQWTVLVNGRAVGTITGTNAYGAFGISGGSTLSLVGNGLANTQYTATMHGQFQQGTNARNILTPSPQQNSINALESADALASGTAQLTLGVQFTAANVVAAKQTYMTVAVVVTSLNGSTTTPITVACAVQVGAGWRWQTKVLRKTGADNSFPMIFHFPLFVRPGDTLSIGFIGVGSGNTAFPIPIIWNMYGLTSYVQPSPLRDDGRCLPGGSLAIGGQNTPNGAGTILIPTSGAQIRTLLGSLSGWTGLIGAVPLIIVQVTCVVNGQQIAPLWGASGVAGSNPGLVIPNVIPEQGLLCDANTPVTISIPGGGAPAWSAFPSVQIQYDLVA